MKKVTFHEEGWVKFQRFHCLEGYIDIWKGDAADNPNNENKSRYHLNSMATAFRLNGEGYWYQNRNYDCFSHLLREYLLMRDEFTAHEIWEEAKQICDK